MSCATAAPRRGAPSGRSARAAPLERRERAALPATAGGTGSSWPADSRRFPPPSGIRTNSRASEHLPKNMNRPRLEGWGVAAVTWSGEGTACPIRAQDGTAEATERDYGWRGGGRPCGGAPLLPGAVARADAPRARPAAPCPGLPPPGLPP